MRRRQPFRVSPGHHAGETPCVIPSESKPSLGSLLYPIRKWTDKVPDWKRHLPEWQICISTQGASILPRFSPHSARKSTDRARPACDEHPALCDKPQACKMELPRNQEWSRLHESWLEALSELAPTHPLAQRSDMRRVVSAMPGVHRQHAV
jgi:hypothetical protein